MLSLKAFHVFFIVLSIGLALSFGVWAIRDYCTNQNVTNLSLGIGSLAGGAALIGYLCKVFSKI